MRNLSRAARALVAVAVALLAALALLAIAGPNAAHAAETQADTKATNGNLTFGIGPALPVPATQVVDGRPYLAYGTAPGGTARDAVALLNLSDAPITLHVYATDAFDTPNGSFALMPAGKKPTGPGSWITMSVPASRAITVPARHGSTYGRVEVPFEAHVPADATPGDHVAGIVASFVSESRDAKGNKLKFDQRIGVRTYFQVAGDLKTDVAVEHLHARHHAGFSLTGALGHGTTTITYDVHNTGNVRINATQLVDVSGWFTDHRLERPTAISDLLPGATVHLSVTIPHRWAFGKQRATVTVFPVPVEPAAPPATGLHSATATSWVIPWILLVILVVLLLLAGLRWWWRRRPARPAGGQRRRETAPGKRVREAKATPVARAVVPLLIALGTAVLGSGPASADVGTPSGGRLMLEPSQITGDPHHAITDGAWGHEGPDHTAPTVISADITDSAGKVTPASQALWLQRFPASDFNDIAIAFVRTSKDGSAERPAVHPGENAGQAFEWFTTDVLGASLSGSTVPAQDGVLTVSDLADYLAWNKDGRPDQVFDANLVSHDDERPGSPVSHHPEGRSIQDAWPAGTDISMVAFKTAGADPSGIPLVAADATGHAITAWLSFRTVAGAADPSLRTSASYHVLSASPLAIAPDKVASPGSTATSTGASGSGGAASAGQSEAASGTAAPSAGGSPTGSGDGSGTRATASPGSSAAAAGHSSHAGSTGIWLGGLALLALLGAAVYFRRRRAA